MDQKQGGLISNVLAIIGFIILIAIIIWGAFHLLNIASSGFSSLFSGATSDKITVTPSTKTVASGQPVDVSWKHAATSGTYAILYQCKSGFQFRIPANGELKALPCGGMYTIGNTQSKTVRLVPSLSGAESLDVVFSVIYIESATSTSSTRPQGSATIKVTNGATADAQTPATPTTGGDRPAFLPSGNTNIGTNAPGGNIGSVPHSVTPPTPPSKADLQVRIMGVGVIDPMSGTFVARAPINPSEVVAVRFDIANRGGTPTGHWYFAADLPTSPAQPYISPIQGSLGPGDHIENTLRFNLVAPQGGTFSVRADSNGNVSESNENNNYATQFVNGSSYQYQNGY